MALLPFGAGRSIKLNWAVKRRMERGFGVAWLIQTTDAWEAWTRCSIVGRDRVLASKVGMIAMETAPVADAIETTKAWLAEALPAGVQFDWDVRRDPLGVRLVYRFKRAEAARA